MTISLSNLFRLLSLFIKSLAVHSSIEEEILYPEMKSFLKHRGDEKKHVNHLIEDHKNINDMLYQLDLLPTVDSNYKKLMNAIIKVKLG